MKTSQMLARISLVSLLALTACGGDPAEDDDVTLSLTWWGGVDRADRTAQAVALFEEQNPGITVELESRSFDGYADLLATQTAANDAPDVQQLAVEMVSDYATRGALLDLDAVDVAALESTTTEAANLDGQQWGVPTGFATGVIAVNPTLFEEAGVDLPDDANWTWDDYNSIAQEITENTPDGIWGSMGMTDFTLFGTVLRQQGDGKNIYNTDGTLAFDAEDAAAYFEISKNLMLSGGAPSASEISEGANLSAEETGVAQNRYAMGAIPSSSFTALSAASGEPILALRPPSDTGGPGEARMALGASSFWAASSRSSHPEEAQELIDFLVNSPEAGEALLVSRGTPPNGEVRQEIADQLDPAEAEVGGFIDEVEEEMVPAPLPPAGSGDVQGIVSRYLIDYLFDRQSLEDATTNMIEEIEADITR